MSSWKRLPSVWDEWTRLEMTVKQQHLAVFCDYDGTLAPIAAKPQLAILPAETKAALQALSRKRHVTTGIVSGRSLRELRAMVRLRNLLYIGSHGYEVAGPGKQGASRVSHALIERLRKLGNALELELRGLRGVWVERKAAGVAVHYRMARRRVATHVLRRLAKQHGKHFRVQEGKMVFEFVPTGTITKGSTVRKALKRVKRHGPCVTLYLGDDLTDETVFAKLGTRDFGIFVGTPRATSARYSLGSPDEVRNFLLGLGAITR